MLHNGKRELEGVGVLPLVRTHGVRGRLRAGVHECLRVLWSFGDPDVKTIADRGEDLR